MSEADVMMSMSPDRAMRETEIMAMRALVDSIQQLTKRFDRYEIKTDEMKSSLDRIEAQDMRGALAEHKIEFTKYRDERALLTAAFELRVKTMELTLARYTGMFIPISILAAAMTSAVGAMLIQKALG